MGRKESITLVGAMYSEVMHLAITVEAKVGSHRMTAGVSRLDAAPLCYHVV